MTMHARADDHREPSPPTLPLAWVVPGPLQQVTGGYLYDSRMVAGLRALGWPVGVTDLRSDTWPLDWPAGRRLVAAVRRERWGAVVVDELAHPALASALMGGRLARALGGVPLVLLVHHLRCSEPAPRPRRALAMLVEGAVARSADLAICTSQTTARTVSRLARGGVQIEVVRPGWDTHTQVPSPPHHGAVGIQGPRGGVERAPFRLLLVGHWTPRKGILEALASLAPLPAAVTLDLVGEQDRDLGYTARVWAILRDPDLVGRVRVHGRVAEAALEGLFAAADALLLPSTHEGYGMVLAEALAAGLPIVATRVGAVPEVVRDGFEADLVPAGDVGALARAIERLASDPAERARRSMLARERAASLPGWSDSVAAFAGHLHALVERPSGRGR